MKILLVYYHFEVCGGRYYLDAFKRLGHDVRHIGHQMSVKDAWGLDTPIAEKYAHVPDSEYRNQSWIDWEPDLILVCDSMFAGEHYRHNYYEDVPHAVIAIDNHVRDYDGDWAHQFLAHYHGPTYPVDPARKDHSWLPCASDPMFTPSPIPWNERAYDVACVGVMYPRRVEVVNALREAGLSVFTATGLLYEEYRDAYWNARISLCVSAAGDVAQRIFETGRMGCAILTDPLLDIADPETCAALKLNGRLEYTNPESAVAIAREMLGGLGDRFIIGGALEAQPTISLGQQAAAIITQSCKPHTWDARAQVIVDWFEREYGKDKSVPELLTVHDWGISKESIQSGVTAQEAVENVNKVRDYINKPVDEATITNPAPLSKPFLNLGCGRTHLPGERPAHHALVPADIYSGREWVNVDRVGNVGADKVFDLFAYPWPLDDNSYDGALLSHLCEHIPHEIKSQDSQSWIANGFDSPDKDDLYFKLYRRVASLQDGWFAFFAELYRVLTPGAEVHILSPHARSDGAISDPTHTRYLLPDSFQHSMVPNPDAPFEYATGGIHFEMEKCHYGLQSNYKHLMPQPTEPLDVQQSKSVQLEHLMLSQNNIVAEFYVRLKVVK